VRAASNIAGAYEVLWNMHGLCNFLFKMPLNFLNSIERSSGRPLSKNRAQHALGHPGPGQIEARRPPKPLRKPPENPLTYVCVAQVRQIWFGLGFGCCLSCRPWGSRVELSRKGSDRMGPKAKLNSTENWNWSSESEVGQLLKCIFDCFFYGPLKRAGPSLRTSRASEVRVINTNQG